MNRNSLLVLAGVALTVTILALLGQGVDRSAVSGGEQVGTEFVPGLAADLNDIERISIVQPGNVEAVTLRNAADGWAVEQQDGYPADVGQLRDALVALSEARVVEEKTANADFYVRLGVDPIEMESAGGTAIRLQLPGKTYPELILGSTSGTNSRYARHAAEATSVLIDRDPQFPADPTQWLKPDLIDIRSDRIQRVEISHADGERLVIAKMSRDDNGFSVADVPPDRELQYATVANVTGNALRELRLQSARATDLAAEPVATTEFWTFDGLVVTLTGTLIDGEPWVSFDARFEPSQALDFATDAVDGSAVSTAAETESTPQAEAAAINERLAAWRFVIPAHIHDQISRRMEDLLRPLETADSTGVD